MYEHRGFLSSTSMVHSFVFCWLRFGHYVLNDRKSHASNVDRSNNHDRRGLEVLLKESKLPQVSGFDRHILGAKKRSITPGSTNIAMEFPPFVDVFPIGTRWIYIAILVYRRVSLNGFFETASCGWG